MTPSQKLRLRFAAAGLAGVAIVVAALVSAHRGAWSGEDLTHLSMTFIGVGAVFLYVWWTTEQHVVRPLGELEREARRSVVATPAEPLADRVDPLFTVVARHIDTLVAQRAREEDETARALAALTGRLDAEKRRLEAVLRDLTEGVIVCAPDGRTVLFNTAAQRILGTGTGFGLGRSVFELLDEAPLRAAFASIDEATGGTPRPRGPLGLAVARRDAGSPLELRIAPIGNASAAATGFVITIAPPPTPHVDDRNPRAIFYDFDLLRQDRALGPLADRPLDGLAFVVFDTETTGLDPDSGDQIIQIGAVRVLNGRVLAEETFDTLVNPGRRIPTRSTRFHGITDDDVADAPPVGAALARFHAFAGEAVLVGHNAAFDMRFVRNREADGGVRFDHPVLDTLFLSMALDPLDPDHSLDALARRFDIPLEGRHNALGDARITARVLVRLIALARAAGVVTLGDAVVATNRFLPPSDRQKLA